MQGNIKIEDVVGEVEVCLGATTITVEEFNRMSVGSIVGVGIPAGEAAFILVNGNPIGRGEIMVFEKNLAVRINSIFDSSEIYNYPKKYFGT